MFVGIYKGIIIPWLLRWCRISSIHSTSEVWLASTWGLDPRTKMGRCAFGQRFFKKKRRRSTPEKRHTQIESGSFKLAIPVEGNMLSRQPAKASRPCQTNLHTTTRGHSPPDLPSPLPPPPRPPPKETLPPPHTKPPLDSFARNLPTRSVRPGQVKASASLTQRQGSSSCRLLPSPSRETRGFIP